MEQRDKKGGLTRIAIAAVVVVMTLTASLAFAGGYDDALKGVKGISAVFDFSNGSPKTSNLLFWAVQNVYEDETVQALPGKSKISIVFHGPAVKLISTDRTGFSEEEKADIDKFQETIRQMKKDGVKLEVCDYALKVMGVDPATIMAEVNHVGNGFISVIGYQAQGYSVVRIP